MRYVVKLGLGEKMHEIFQFLVFSYAFDLNNGKKLLPTQKKMFGRTVLWHDSAYWACMKKSINCTCTVITIWTTISNFRVGEKEGFMTQSTIGQLASSASGLEK